MAAELPNILQRHGLSSDDKDAGAGLALQETIFKARFDAEYRRSGLSRARSTQGFPSAHLHACKAAASKLIRYANGSTPRDPATPGTQRENITNQINFSRVIQLVLHGLPDVVEIIQRVDDATQTVEDLAQLVRAIDQLLDDDRDGRGRPNSPDRHLIGNALDVWRGAGRTSADCPRAPLVAFIRDLFELAGAAPTAKSAEGIADVTFHRARDANIREKLLKVEAVRRQMAADEALQNS